MKKESAIEQVYLAVHGGVLTNNSRVQRVDIEPYLCACINQSIGLGRKEDWVQVWRGSRAGVPVVLDSSAHYFNYEYTLEKDQDRCRSFVTLSPNPIIIESPLLDIQAYKSGEPYVKTASAQSADHVGYYSNTVLYWHEKDDDGVFKVWFKNLEEGKVIVRMCPDTYNLAWDKEISIPDDRLKICIVEATDFFRKQRFGLPDTKIDGDDKPEQSQQ